MKKSLLLTSITLLLLINVVSSQTLTIPHRRLGETEIDKLSTSDFGRFLPPSLAAAPQSQELLKDWQDAARFARDNPKQFSRLLEMYSRYGKIVDISPDAEKPEIKALAYALLALSSDAELNTYFQKNGIAIASVEHNAILSEVRALRAAVKTVSLPTIAVFATGNIRNVATDEAPDPTATGTGTLGATYKSSTNMFSVQLSVASTLDTVKGGYGSFLLAPLNGESLQSAAIEWFPRFNKWSKNSWLHFYGNFASSLWEIEKDSLYKNATTLGLGALYHHRIFEGLIAETEVGLSGEIGLAGRWISGDIRNLLEDDANKAKYLAVFPTEKSFFPGLEAGISLNFGQVVGALQAYYLLSKEDEPIEGLSRMQISVGLSVRGDIVKGFLGSRD